MNKSILLIMLLYSCICLAMGESKHRRLPKGKRGGKRGKGKGKKGKGKYDDKYKDKLEYDAAEDIATFEPTAAVTPTPRPTRKPSTPKPTRKPMPPKPTPRPTPFPDTESSEESPSPDSESKEKSTYAPTCLECDDNRKAVTGSVSAGGAQATHTLTSGTNKNKCTKTSAILAILVSTMWCLV